MLSSLTHNTLRATIVAAMTLAAAPLSAQWTDHFAYSSCTLSAVVGDVPVCGNNYSLFYYDAAEGYIGRLNKINHLSSTGMSAIADYGNSLIVGYVDGNIDIVDMTDLTTVNIPELKNSNAVNNKAINNICVSGTRAYLATTGGVAELDLVKDEIRSFWRIASSGVSANAVCVADGRIYVGTTAGLYTASLSSKMLEDYAQWTLLTAPTGNVASLAPFNGVVYAGVGTVGRSCSVWKINGTSATQAFTTANYFRNLSSSDSYLIVTQGAKIQLLDKDLKEVTSIVKIKSADDVEEADVISNPSFRSTRLLSNETLAIAERDSGLVITNFNSIGKSIKPDGPFENKFEDIFCQGGDVYVTGYGHTELYNSGYRTVFSALHDDEWSVSRAETYTQGREVAYFAEDPVSGQIYLSTFGSGVFMINDYKLGKRFSYDNSILERCYGDVVRTDGIWVDKDQNLIVINNSVTNGLKIMDKDSTWYAYSYGPMSSSHSTVGMVGTSNGNIWLVSSVMHTPYLCVFNINGTPETDADDLYMTSAAAKESDPQFVGTFDLVDASSGETVGTRATTVAVSADGSVWVGTTAGLLVTTDNKTMLQTGSVTFNRIKVPRNDGTNLADYLLDGQFIYDIKVDGADRKWIATDNGVYLVSPDGLTTIHHFTAEDSPLPSNTVLKVGIRKSDGEVFFCTGGGLVSYRGDAIAPAKTLTKIKIFPNPVSATGLSGVDYVTMTGFENSSPIFITDVAGNRVYRTSSLGGMARWGLRREGGGRVASGVYIVWATNSDGKNSAVGKILVTE